MRGAGRERRGFTLLEAILVVAILVVVAGAAVPVLLDSQQHMIEQAARAEMATLRDACLRFRQDTTSFPLTLAELTATATPASVTTFTSWDPDSRRGWRGPYLIAPRPMIGTDLADPWGRPYRYGPDDSGGHEIVSRGFDGKDGDGLLLPRGQGDDLVERFR